MNLCKSRDSLTVDTRIKPEMKAGSPVESLQEYISRIHYLLNRWKNVSSPTHAWFRGQSHLDWTLQPSLIRGPRKFRERRMFRDFKLRASAFSDVQFQSDVELLFAMQHHGMPTRLLDWTESHLIALFFAVAQEDSDCNGAVWAIRPASLNRFSGFSYTVPMSNHRVFEDYTLDVDSLDSRRNEVEAVSPMALRPRRNTPRLVAQRGLFTIHGSDSTPLEKLKGTRQRPAPVLEKIIICGESKALLKKELFLAGISYSLLFPDLDGLSKEVSYRYSEDYPRIKISKIPPDND